MAKASGVRISPKQAVLVALGAIGLAYTTYTVFWGSDRVDVVKSVFAIDSTTGQLYELALNGQTAAFPEINPDTGAETLLPVALDENGNWVLMERFRGYAAQMKPRPAAVEDFRTGKLKLASGDPKRTRLKR